MVAEKEVMVVGIIYGPHEAWGCVIYSFLVKFSDERKLVTDGWTDQPTDGPSDRRMDTPSYRDAMTHLKRAAPYLSRHKLLALPGPTLRYNHENFHKLRP